MVKFKDTFISGDHDLIVELKVRMEDLRSAIKELTDGTSLQLRDHETRLRVVEQNMWMKAGVASVIVMLLGFAVAFVLKLIP